MSAPHPAAASPVLPVRHSWIANREVEGRAGRRPVVNPATGAAFARTSLLDAEQAASAIAAARAAFPAWAALSFRERARALLAAREVVVRRADEIARLIEQEQGKPAVEAHLVEVFPALEVLQHLALHAEDLLSEQPVPPQVLLFAHKDSRIRYEPFGVVLVVTPWNYPFGISLSGVATALAAGNTVVLKPAPATTLVGLGIAEVFREAGVPDGAVNVVAVDDTLAPALVEDPRVDKIVFTGSPATGRRVMVSAAKNLTPVVLELGGKDPAVVCRDADLDRAARGIVWGAFVNAGQTCASVERVYVEAEVAHAFLGRVVELTRSLRVGDPAAGEVELGALTLERQRKIVEEHVADAVARGARVLTGGRAAAGPGWFYPPTVLSGVDHTMRVMQEETFGPVLPVMAVPSLDEAIRLANDSEYGLTASGWTRDAATAGRLERELQAGVVTINDCVYTFGEPSAPWGGFKRSGLGRAHGLAGLREMAQPKYVARDEGAAPMLWWFPYGEELRGLMPSATRALHARSRWARLANAVRLLGSSRFRRRGRLASILKRADRLF
jgi:succinate-semialdehyde dehydrogenase/glutarate-semialdehyde dehydrogenase